MLIHSVEIPDFYYPTWIEYIDTSVQVVLYVIYPCEQVQAHVG